MKYTYDQLCAVFQNNPDEKGGMTETEQNLRDNRYKNRKDGIYRDIHRDNESRENEARQEKKLETMDQKIYESKRIGQAIKLYFAYKGNRVQQSLSVGPNFSQMNYRVQTDEQAVRRVTGEHSDRGIYNTDILYLDHETIKAIEALVYAQSILRGDDALEIPKGLNGYQIMHAVDQMMALKQMLIIKDCIPEGEPEPTYRQLATETDILKRAMGKELNENVFGIDDYEVNAKQMTLNKRNLFHLVWRSLKQKVKDLNKTNDKTTPKKERFGDKNIDFDDSVWR